MGKTAAATGRFVSRLLTHVVNRPVRYAAQGPSTTRRFGVAPIRDPSAQGGEHPQLFSSFHRVFHPMPFEHLNEEVRSP